MEKLINTTELQMIKSDKAKKTNGGGAILEGAAWIIGFLVEATQDYNNTMEEYCGSGTFNERHGVCME